MNKLTKLPKLKCGNDEQVAEKLNAIIGDAKDGIRRIISAGLFFQYIDANLEHGELEPWVDAHCKTISRATFFGWKKLAGALMETMEIKQVQLLDFSVPLHDALALPASKLPEEIRIIREKMDSEIEGKSYRQLTLEFRSNRPDGGYRPNAEAVQNFLKLFHKELKGQKFDALPPEIQAEYKACLKNTPDLILPPPDPNAKHITTLFEDVTHDLFHFTNDDELEMGDATVVQLQRFIDVADTALKRARRLLAARRTGFKLKNNL